VFGTSLPNSTHTSPPGNQHTRNEQLPFANSVARLGGPPAHPLPLQLAPEAMEGRGADDHGDSIWEAGLPPLAPEGTEDALPGLGDISAQQALGQSRLELIPPTAEPAPSRLPRRLSASMSMLAPLGTRDSTQVATAMAEAQVLMRSETEVSVRLYPKHDLGLATRSTVSTLGPPMRMSTTRRHTQVSWGFIHSQGRVYEHAADNAQPGLDDNGNSLVS
jgi:hypothetical protein